MHRAQGQVREFHEVVLGEAVESGPPEIRRAEANAICVAEEAAEVVMALLGRDAGLRLLRERALRAAGTAPRRPDLAEVVDGLCDLIYVAYGAAEAAGVDLEPFFDVVHAANMRKTGEVKEGEEVKRGRKPPGWEPPPVARMLAELVR